MNLVVLGGNLVRDPELRYLPDGTPLCEFTIANSKKWKNKSDELVEKTGFFNCVAWSKRGETISKCFQKGKGILVKGELEFQSWETDAGEKRSTIKVNVLDFDFVGNKGDAPASGTQAGNATSAQEPVFPAPKADVNEEEIPF